MLGYNFKMSTTTVGHTNVKNTEQIVSHRLCVKRQLAHIGSLHLSTPCSEVL